MNPSMKNPSQYEDRILFLILLAFEVFHLFFLVLSHRMPIGHDGFQYFSLEYFFLNDSTVNGEVPLWIPYMNHGITATWFYTIQGSVGLLANALLLAGRAIASVNFLDIFHGGIFVDRLLLLTGVWLLGQRYFNSALTRFFVASCVMGSTVTMTQFNFTLHLYYAIPLLLYFGHAFLDTGRWRFFFLASNLFMIQTFGKNADTCTIVSLTVFLYFLFYALDAPSQFYGQIKNLRWRFASVTSITASLLSLGMLAAIFTAGRDTAMVNLNGGRSFDSSVPLNIFLTYAGNMDFHKWQELFLRISPSLDFTVYMGFLAVPLILFGLLYNRNRNQYPLLLVSLILLFFSMGTWVSVFFYYAWPMMKFYRHLALIVPVIKLLLLFLAGFGFEKIFVQRDAWQGQRKISYACLLTGFFFLLLSMVLVQMSSHGLEASRYIVRFLTVQTSQNPSVFNPYTVSLRLSQASLFSLLAGFLFLLLPLVPFKKFGTAVILIALLINTGDIYGYYCTEINERTFVLNKDQYKITAFSPMPYAYRRLISAPNSRQEILSSPAGRLTIYATVNAFLFQDALATRYRTIERMKPLHEMVTAFGPKVLKNPAFLKIAGSSVDKIQFFSHACFDGDDKQSASYISNSKYQGDSLILSGASVPFVPACSSQKVLTDNDRITLPYQIQRFTPNVMELSVNVPFTKPVWMMYADVWHRGWQAQINGKNVSVLKADMAYKAVLLPPGKNIITFRFVLPEVVFFEKITAINALLWIFILLYLMVGILRRRP
jgi:hypothetical protein